MKISKLLSRCSSPTIKKVFYFSEDVLSDLKCDDGNHCSNDVTDDWETHPIFIITEYAEDKTTGKISRNRMRICFECWKHTPTDVIHTSCVEISSKD